MWHVTRLSSLSNLARFCFAAGVIALASQAKAAYPTGNLITNPGFETNSLTSIFNVLGSPYSTGIWGDEASTITGTVGAVVPSGGTQMLSMTTDGNADTQTLQSVDVTAFSSDINAGLLTASFNAKFNVDKDVTGGLAGIYLQFFNSAHTYVGATNINSLLVLDSNPATWQQISLTNIPVPVGTSYLLPQVLYNNASMTDANGIDHAGYVDDSVLTLNTVPEPASLGLCTFTALGMIRVRRRS
jgi:hypothetical protein